MKSICLFLLMLFIATGCNANGKNSQADMQKQETDLFSEVNDKYSGKHIFNSEKEETFGNVSIYSKTDNTISFELYIEMKGNSGEISGEMEIENGKGVFKSTDDGDCILEFVFTNNSVKISHQEGGYQCGFGMGVAVNHTFVKKATSATTSANVSPDCLITQNSVGEFRIGQQINLPYKSNTYKIERDEYEESVDGEDYTAIAYRVFEKGKEVLTMRPIIDVKGRDTKKMCEFFILSEKFKTNEGIGVNSTIEDFVKCYPNYRIWWAYIGGSEFILDSEDIDGISFYLNTEDVISYPEIDNEGITTMKISDFKKGTKIYKIFIQNTEN